VTAPSRALPGASAQPYLQQRSREIGWHYHRLETFEQFVKAVQINDFTDLRRVVTDIRDYAAIAALLLLALVYLPLDTLISRLRPNTRE